ncbi:MAG: hypothetical protein ACLPWS_20745 [Rhodomicrobium sp.]
MGVLEERQQRRDELQDTLDAVESGRLVVGDYAATEEYKRVLRKSIELLDQIIQITKNLSDEH